MPENNRKIELSPSLNAGLGIHKFYFPRAFFSKDLKEIVEPLLAIFNNDSGFPLYIQDNVEYYPSVTSTILIALYHTRMIDDEFKNRIQTTIFNLKTRTDNKTKKERNPEDVAAWDVSEGANCWTTSMVIESLLETGYSGNGIDEIKEAILWLKDQQKDDGGWGFDRICISKVFFTARVMYALHLGKRLFNPECSQSRDLERSLLMGEDFIKNKVRTGFNIYYWPDEADDNKPDPTNTIIALWILNKLTNWIKI